jgi:SOS response regulatory protein OraA/RecX
MLGVSEDILNDLLVDGDEEESAYNAAIRMAQKKRDSGMDASEISRIIYPFLRRRGFDASVIHSTTGRIASELFP